MIINGSDNDKTYISPMIDVYSKRKLFEARKSLTFDDSRKSLTLNDSRSSRVKLLEEMSTSNNGICLKFIKRDVLGIDENSNFSNSQVSLYQDNFKINLIGDMEGKLFQNLIESEELGKLKETLDLLPITFTDENTMINYIRNAIVIGWNGQNLIIGGYKHTGVYLADILLKACAKLLFNNCSVPNIQNVWIFTSTVVEMITDENDKHLPYNIYQLNLDRNLLVQVST